jgi:hypothetical protein
MARSIVKWSGEAKHVTWNGLDDAGKQVTSGIYLYFIESKEYIYTKKMIFLK